MSQFDLTLWQAALALLSLHPIPPNATERPVRTEFRGPGYYCGGNFLVRLEQGDRVVFTPPEIDVALLSLDIAGHHISGGSGSGGDDEGRIIARFRGTTVRQVRDEGRLYYSVDDGMFALTLWSEDFRGYRRDRWFLDRVNFAPGAERGVTCLEAQITQ